jgi:hypothetical protein
VRVEEALPVKLAEGAPIEGVEIRIKKRKTASIRGRVLGDAPPGAPPDVSIGLFGIQQQLTGMSFSIIAQGKLKAGDEFEIDHLNPCTCYLSATMRGDRPKVALLSLVIGEDNQDGLDLNLRPTVSLNGHVRMEGREPGWDQPALPTDSVRISFNGRASFAGLIAGAYRLIAYTPGAQWADDPGFRDRMRNGTRIEVTANQQQQIELRAQSLR